MNFKNIVSHKKGRKEKTVFPFLFFIIISLSFSLFSCDSAFRYIFISAERIQYTLVPDSSLIQSLNDSSYYVSKDGQSAVFDKKDYKIEIKYLSDYQLNNFEFPEESKNGEFSTNPFTYANWMDPQLGYTPNRFTVFKITIYDYASPKINFDPENAFLYTDRGDNLFTYGKDQKTSRYQSMEVYFKRRAGSGGIQDDIYEGRMGIVRNTIFTFGKPLFRGDSRQGLIIFDPLSDEVDKVKLKIDRFILGYDENNEANEFTDILGYFKRIPLVISKDQQIAALNLKDSSNIFVLPDFDMKSLSEKVDIALLQFPATNITNASQEYWNSAPEALTELSKYINSNTNMKITPFISNIESEDFKKARIACIFGHDCSPTLTDTMIGSLVAYLKNGGFLFVDNANAQVGSSFGQSMDKILQTIAAKLGDYVKYQRIPMTNPIFSVYQKFKSVPPGQEAYLTETSQEQMADYLEGITVKGKIVAIISHKGYSKVWGTWKQGGRNLDNTPQLNLGTNFVVYSVVSNMKKTGK